MNDAPHRLVSEMIAASHILFGSVVCLAISVVLKVREVHSPPRLFYLFTLFMMEFPDVDHLYGMRIQPAQLIPFTVWDLFKWQLRTERYPLTLLHFWIYPFIILALLTLSNKSPKRSRWLLVGAFLGWTVHLALDGVIFFV